MMYISFRQIFYLFNLLLFLMMGACSSGASSAFQANGLDESQFAGDSSLRASFSNVVAVHLEHPSGGAMENDTGGI